MNNHSADVLVIVFEKERTSVTCWPPSRNLGALGRGDLLLCAGLSWPQFRAKSCVFSGWHFNSLCFRPRHDAPRQWSVWALLPHYWSCARLNRITSSREPKSAYMVSLTSRCPVSDTLLWGSGLPKQSWLWGLPLLYILKTKWIFHPSFFGEKNSVQD